MQSALQTIRETSECNVLPPDVCSEFCLPAVKGTGPPTNFTCGDWWQVAHCCNGSQTHKLVETIYFSCTCATDGLTRRALAVIIALAIGSFVVMLCAFLYVHRVRHRKSVAEQEERDRAEQDAAVFLPR